MVTVSGISKRYGSQNALTNVSFTVPDGQVLGLLGQNGAGKTTLLNILAGYLAPSSGSVTIGEFDIMTQSRNAKRLLGYLPEQPPLYDEMTVAGYLKFVCELKEILPREISPHIAEVAKATGLSDITYRKIGNLSKGYRQRIGLAQALCGNPDVLFLDEPTIGLDPRQTADFRETLRSLGKNHTVIFSSHILSEVQSLCDRVIILHHGMILCDSELNVLSGTGFVRLRVCIDMEPGKVLPALKTLPSVARVVNVPKGEVNDRITDVILEAVPGQSPQRELFTLLSGLQAPILRLTPVEDTLEDIFLRATAG